MTNRHKYRRLKAMPLVIVSLVLFALPASVAAQPVLNLDSGPIMGMRDGPVGDLLVFKGIPYAAPPVGANRWRPPQPVPSWRDVRACTAFAATCPQPDVMRQRFGVEQPPLSEDCLYLNVWAPARAEEALPVMVWIHGGGFVIGSGSAYDGAALARQGVVVVTINYRVGVLGFMAHEALSAEPDGKGSGNYGLMDIVAALQWVQRNIEHFGGDPQRVTVFGQSSGGTAVVYLLASPMARGLFHRGIAQSAGAYDLLVERGDAEALGQRLFAAAGAAGAPDPLAAMRGKPWREILDVAAASHIRFGPVLDGRFMREQPIDIFSAGHQSNVPLIIGSNFNEADDEYTMAAWYFAREHSRKNANTYRYVFTMPTKNPRFAGHGAVHAAEIPYVFGTGSTVSHFTPDDHALAREISARWVLFARNGDPNRPGERQWPRYKPGEAPYLELGTEIRAAAEFRETKLAELERAFKVQRAAAPATESTTAPAQ